MKTVKLLALLSMLLIMGSQASATEIVEWAPFQIKEDVSDEELIQAAEAVENGFLTQQKGYIKRLLLKGKDGYWVDIVYWRSEAEAKSAATAAYESPICFNYFSLMKESEHSGVSDIQHFDIVKSWR